MLLLKTVSVASTFLVLPLAIGSIWLPVLIWPLIACLALSWLPTVLEKCKMHTKEKS